MMNKLMPILLSFLLFASVLSCSQEVIKRDRTGTRRSQEMVGSKNISLIKKKVALLSFFNESPYGGDDIAIVATEEFRRELLKTGVFVLDTDAEKMFGSSKEIFAGGGIKLSQLARKAKLTGINFVLFGRIKEARVRQRTDEIGLVRETKSYAEAAIELRLFDVSSVKEILTKTFSASVDDKNFKLFSDQREEALAYRQELLRYSVQVAVRKTLPTIVKLSAKMDWRGRVAKIIGSQIYINAGRRSGLNVGDVLRVMTEGKEIYDPETGALLGVSKGEVKGTLEIVDYFGPDGAIAILHSGGSVTEGDFVELY